MGFILIMVWASKQMGLLNQKQKNPIPSFQQSALIFRIPMGSKAVRKAIYHQKLFNHLQKHHTQILIVAADNLQANQIQLIRQGLRGGGDSEVVMGKNTLMRRSIAIHAPATGNTAFLGLVSHIVGKVGLVFTARDPDQVSEAVAGYKLQPWLCSSMDIGVGSHWQWLLSSHLDLLTKSNNVSNI